MGGSYERGVEGWRARRQTRLSSPDGWLALVGLWWLEEGPNPVGADPGSRVILTGSGAPDRLGSIHVDGPRAVLTVLPGVAVTSEGAPVTQLELRDDAAGPPTTVHLGSLSFHLIRREGRLAVRVRDAESPVLQAFAGTEFFPVDRRWRVEAAFEPYHPARAVPVPTVLGRAETYQVPGAVAFAWEGTVHRLDAFLEAPDSDLFIVFGDLTNGVETFAGGRYLYAKPPKTDAGVVVLDFNKAYNPPCVFTPFATCALPLPQNRLPIRVEAGERRYGKKA
jgi:uncharacterized protein (DUF1684 family)